MTDFQLPLIDELLSDRTYHIEFNGHLSNHVKHAVVALAGLGASPQRIKAYYDGYAKLTPYGYGLEAPKPSKHVISTANWEQFLGQRTSFWAYCALLERQERELGVDGLLRRYLPALLPGWVGAFTHAAIHLGWALDANNRWMIIEGLAYMAFAYVSCHPERGASRRDAGHDGERAEDSLLRIAGVWDDDREALTAWVEGLVADTAAGTAAGIHPELMRSGLQYRIARLLAAGHPLIYDTPSWIDDQAVSTSWDQLYYVVTLLYLAQPGDFVLIHLITSLYAMEQIADRLPADQRTGAVKCFWMGMLCIVFSRAAFPARAQLAALHTTYQDAFDLPAQQAVVQDWDHIVARAIEEDEEHNPKMVYVLQRVWERSGRRTVYRAAAACFTTTPELPKSFEEPPNE
jgi:questin oxidase-like protein